MVEEQSLIPTRASILKGLNKVEEVSFISYKPKAKKITHDDDTSSKPVDENPTFVMKKVKNEIFRFGMSKLEGQEKRNAKMQLAIKLGAKPPRKKCINYKRLLEQKKNTKIDEESNIQLQQVGKNSLGKSIAKDTFDKKRKKDHRMKKKGETKGLLEVYGKVKVK